jgi:AraC-like DNA-binding protein
MRLSLWPTLLRQSRCGCDDPTDPLSQLEIRRYEKAEQTNKRLSDRRLRQVFVYIEDNLAENIALADLAAVVGLSVSHFNVLFREAVGLSPHQYLIRRRVERAKNLLGEGKLSISQIAAETGFAHQSHLARHMHRMLGIAPKALRKQCENAFESSLLSHLRSEENL